MISKENFEFPRAINNISDMSKTLIRRMLKANPKERLSWEELFQHEVTRYIEKKMEKELSLTLTMDGSLSENVCKLYLNQNLVIIHPSEFRKKEEVVDYAVNLVRDGKKNDFKGAYNRQIKEND
jgi:serine/threonine protein kinase